MKNNLCYEKLLPKYLELKKLYVQYKLDNINVISYKDLRKFNKLSRHYIDYLAEIEHDIQRLKTINKEELLIYQVNNIGKKIIILYNCFTQAHRYQKQRKIRIQQKIRQAQQKEEQRQKTLKLQAVLYTIKQKIIANQQIVLQKSLPEIRLKQLQQENLSLINRAAVINKQLKDLA